MAYFLKKTNNKKGTYLQIYSSFYDPERRHTAHKAYKPIGYVHELQAKGIERGDIITKVNGEDAFENSDVSDAKEGLNAGDTLTFTVWRDGRTLDITVKLMDPADMGK